MRKLTAGQQKLVVLVIGVTSAGVVAVLDYLAGSAYSLAAVYLLPLYFVTLQAGRGPGLLLALVSGGFQWAAGHYAGAQLQPLSEALWRLVSWGAVYILGVILLARMQRALSRTRALSLTDFLTGALNSRALYNLVENEYLKTQRYGRPMTLAYVGVDAFKAINSRLGHTVGDTLLQKVARTMMRYLRATDRVARLGGDEYAVLLPETDQEAAKVVIPKIRDHLGRVMEDNGWRVTFSIGVVTFFSAPRTPREMIRASERLMWSVKKAGKNKIRYASYHG
ncbi:MAG: GGDEF domain-containing protein [Desulfobacterales bacterium]|nr:GGDEF domain-containing protein [Desulfobacterales bacterium]